MWPQRCRRGLVESSVWRALVARVPDNFTDVDGRTGGARVARSEVQSAFAVDVGREPVAAVNHFAPGHKRRMKVLLAFLGVVGDHPAVGDDDLKIVVVDPDPAVQVSMALVNLLWADVEDIAVDLIHLLLAVVADVVGGKVGGCEDKKVADLQVLEI